MNKMNGVCGAGDFEKRPNCLQPLVRQRTDEIEESFGIDAFSVKTMRKYLSKETYKKLLETIRRGNLIDQSVAAEAASGLKRWALSRGATHHTHWFQPLTGTTAEKHDSFLESDRDGNAVMSFSGSELTQGEPDASSFPSGGLRSTFEARGYTVWDPTSPAFVKHDKYGATLCIPTAFCSYSGDALDKKTPLLRSERALSAQVKRLLSAFGKTVESKVTSYLGVEQEYFLIDRKVAAQRPDLIQTGRTLFGRPPAKHQQMDDHYFGAIPTRVLDFMSEVDQQLWRMGVSAKTRHNEVAPAQFEIASLFNESNISADQNMMIMEVLRLAAERNGFICVMHEKPFADINGSGKHCNWSVGYDGHNLFDPGDDLSDNLLFITVVICLLKAVDSYPELLRVAAASAGNDHRLGANEAPPAIMSVYLGKTLEQVVRQLAAEGADHISSNSEARDFLDLDTHILPQCKRDDTDRNRTSPFAFTGNRFEFRSVGSGQHPADAATCMNTIMAEAISQVCDLLEEVDPQQFELGLTTVLQKQAEEHLKIIFSGDGYSDDWVEEASARGLPNLKTTPEALEYLVTDKTVALFEKHRVMSERELRCRYNVEVEKYETTIKIESDLLLDLVRTEILPAAIDQQRMLADTAKSLRESGVEVMQNLMVAQMEALGKSSQELMIQVEALASAEESCTLIQAMRGVRRAVDQLEGLIDEKRWPFPKYRHLLFSV